MFTNDVLDSSDVNVVVLCKLVLLLGCLIAVAFLYPLYGLILLGCVLYVGEFISLCTV